MSTKRWIGVLAVAGLMAAMAVSAQAQTIVEPYSRQELGQRQFGPGSSGRDFDDRDYGMQRYTSPYDSWQDRSDVGRRFDQRFDSRPYANPYFEGTQRQQFRSFDNRQFDGRGYASPYYNWSQGRQPPSLDNRRFDDRGYASPYYDWSQGRQPQAFDRPYRQDDLDQRWDTRPYGQGEQDRWQDRSRQWQSDRDFDDQGMGGSFYDRNNADRWRDMDRQNLYDRQFGTRPYDQYDSSGWQWQDPSGLGRQGFDQRDFDDRGFNQGFGSSSRQWQYGQEQFSQPGGQFRQGGSVGSSSQRGGMQGGAGGGRTGGGSSPSR